MDDRLFDEFLANTLVGTIAVGLGLILISVARGSRGNLGLALFWILTGSIVVVSPLVVNQVDPEHIRLVERLYPLPILGAILAVIVYLHYLNSTAQSEPRAETVIRVTAWTGVVFGTCFAALGFIYPDRFLNGYVYALDGPGALQEPDFLQFAVLTVIPGIGFTAAWIVLSRQRLDTGERRRALTYGYAVAPLLLSLVVNEPGGLIIYAFVLLLGIFATVEHLTVQGERAAFLSRFLSPQVAELVRLRGLDAVMQPQELVLSVICIDFRGFTAYTDAIPSQAVIELISDYHEAIAEAVATHDGMVKDYAGDGILILVGAPIPREDHRQAAVALARDCLAAAERVTGRWATGAHPLGVGIGVASGRVTVGAIGQTARMDYTAVGTPVNLAARLCAVAESGQVLLDDQVAEVVLPDLVSSRGEIELKGLGAPIAVFELIVRASV